MSRTDFRVSLAFLALSVFTFSGCERNMRFQPKLKPYREFSFFSDGRSQRPPVASTIARGQLHEDELLHTGKVNGTVSDQLPFPVTKELLERGQERYDIYCSVCHDRTGSGRGMVVRRGFSQPPSFHIERLQKSPAGYFFGVITNGYNRMPAYAAQIPVKDRWAIVAYLRALQLSQDAKISDVPQDERKDLEDNP
jgi:mono/diheme cytochrome c family protein